MRNYLNPTCKRSLLLSGLLTFTLFVYYAVVEDAITSVAHVCAILMGILISYVFNKRIVVYPLESDSYQLITPNN